LRTQDGWLSYRAEALRDQLPRHRADLHSPHRSG
jgi:hypothetical protein